MSPVPSDERIDRVDRTVFFSVSVIFVVVPRFTVHRIELLELDGDLVKRITVQAYWICKYRKPTSQLHRDLKLSSVFKITQLFYAIIFFGPSLLCV
jgi:hypothetical protein